MKKFIILTTTVLIFMFSSCFTYADSFKTVSLGADLTQSQKQAVLSEFGVNSSDVEVITISNSDEHAYLDGIAPQTMIGTKSYSCAYVEPLSDGSGLNVSTKNLTWVSKEMIANALFTAGIKDAKVIATAPFNVSGTAALTGIMRGFEKATGKTLDSAAKEAATKEMVTTGELGQDIGQDKASQLMSEVKQEVISQGAKNPDDIKSIIKKIADKEGITLSDDQINKIADVFQKISTLDLKLDDMKNQLKNISDILTKGFSQGNGILAKIQAILESIKTALANLADKIQAFIQKFV